jgi:putative flippase GtrA
MVGYALDVERSARESSLATIRDRRRMQRSGIVGQGVRFAMSGGVVALVYLVTTTLLAEAVGLPFQAALAIGFSVAIAMHFTLQRVFVWVHHEEFALPLRQQVGRYLIAAVLQYGLTAASTAFLPSLLGVPTETVYLVTVAVLGTTNFLVFRFAIFHAEPAPAIASPADVAHAE